MSRPPPSDLPYVPDGAGSRLTVRVTPRAGRSGFAGNIDIGEGRRALAVRLAAPPVEGAANLALVELLAARLGVPRSSVRIVSGDKSRIKVVALPTLAPAALAEKLAAAD
ncbi:MAG: DUF167 domain-containing protein [Allosphingosinicella sp.]